MESSPHQFNNIGYMLSDVPKDIMDKLCEEVFQIQNNPESADPWNKSLIGHIVKEYQLPNSQKFLSPFILDLADEFDNAFSYSKELNHQTHGVPLTLGMPWVNFQKKHEFNPVHNHSGILSYVIYVKIPYDLEQEFSEGPGRLSNDQINGCFQFVYTNSLGYIALHKLNVDKTYENKILIFPSKLNHCVYPFYTSDEYRISVAGNVYLDTSKYSV